MPMHEKALLPLRARLGGQRDEHDDTTLAAKWLCGRVPPPWLRTPHVSPDCVPTLVTLSPLSARSERSRVLSRSCAEAMYGLNDASGGELCVAIRRAANRSVIEIFDTVKTCATSKLPSLGTPFSPRNAGMGCCWETSTPQGCLKVQMEAYDGAAGGQGGVVRGQSSGKAQQQKTVNQSHEKLQHTTRFFEMSNLYPIKKR